MSEGNGGRAARGVYAYVVGVVIEASDQEAVSAIRRQAAIREACAWLRAQMGADLPVRARYSLVLAKRPRTGEASGAPCGDP